MILTGAISKRGRSFNTQGPDWGPLESFRLRKVRWVMANVFLPIKSKRVRRLRKNWSIPKPERIWSSHSDRICQRFASEFRCPRNLSAHHLHALIWVRQKALCVERVEIASCMEYSLQSPDKYVIMSCFGVFTLGFVKEMHQDMLNAKRKLSGTRTCRLSRYGVSSPKSFQHAVSHQSTMS
jgi:hypothetical protein